MLDLIPEHLRLFFVIGGLLMTLLLLGSLSQKYEQYMAAKRLAVNRVMAGITQIEAALEKTQIAGLPPGVARLLRNELLARYITIRQIYPKYPQLNQLIAQAEEQARTEPEGSDSVNGAAITTVAQLNRYIIGLSEVLALFNGQLLGRARSAADRKSSQIKLIDFQLMAAQRFYTRIVTEYAQKGEWQAGLKSARSLDSFLLSKPKVSSLATQLRNEAKVLVQAMTEHRLPGQAAQPALEQQPA
ncbi:MAG: hypothetical protein OQL17_06420 [Sedimenticola sp.]|nr:hypothetical protein [Sedimenticola sp.]MCW8949603.1 hypothetical protein [Sedimenticola sp.]MCW8974646.1 hypothetical protein [Sedimenticola sp.]